MRKSTRRSNYSISQRLDDSSTFVFLLASLALGVSGSLLESSSCCCCSGPGRERDWLKKASEESMSHHELRDALRGSGAVP